MSRRHHGGHGGLSALFNPASMLSGRKLKRASKALTRLEINPQVNEYNRLAKQLQQQGNVTNQGISAMGDRISGQTNDVYRNMAQSAAEGLARQNAIGNLLRQRTGQVTQQAAADQTNAQQGQLGDYMQGLQMRGAPGGGAAQQALANTAAAEQSRMAQANQAASNFANASAGAYQQYGSGQAAANQQRGTEAITNIQRDIASRIAQNALRTNQDVAEARGKASDVEALRGATRVKNLTDLRESERNFMLSGQAVGMDQAKLAEQAREFNKEAKLRKKGKWTGGSGSSSSSQVDQTVISSGIQQALAKAGGRWPAPGKTKQRANFINNVMSAEGVKPQWRPQVAKRIQRALQKHGW